METKTYTTVDRAGWPPGPWDGEPDKVQWTDSATGLPCLAVRVLNWCGYVGVPESHAMYGKSYSDLEVEVHGGLTFSDACQPDADETQDICHTPSPGEPHHVWWFGFDCAHAGDFSPRDVINARRGYPLTIRSDQQYRTLAYVQQQCVALAAQLVTL